jgi:hypothetical protein
VFQIAIAHDIPVLKDVQVIATLKFDKNLNIYEYSYVVSNPSYSMGNIDNLQIDISKPLQSQDLSADGLIIIKGISRRGRVVQDTFEDEIADIGSRMDKPIIPVGTNIPDGWMGGISLMGTVSWGSRNKTSDILPGQSLNGYVIMSRGVPTIREALVRPDWVYVAEGYVTEEDEKEARRIKEEITFKGKTIGPTAPPEELEPADFLQGLIDMKHEATELGWITSKGIERSLDAKLDSAKKKLQSGNTKAASNILGAFINEVEAQGCETLDDCPKGKHLSPEAYALLKFNAQYLLDNLK